jgi:hypothetical protein
MPTKTCFARVLRDSYIISGTTEECWNTDECGAPATKTITVDDGDATFGICSACLRRFLTKKSKNDIWWGWFDCEIPDHARVKGGQWYRAVLEDAWAAVRAREAAATTTPAESEDEEEPEPEPEPELAASAALISDSPCSAAEPAAETPKQALERQIADLVTWTKAQTKTTKEVIKANREIIRLRAELKLLK